MAYATTQDVQDRINRELTETEQNTVGVLLDDAAVIIDVFNEDADNNIKKIVSCRMVARAIGDGETDIPVGASQGSMSGLGYSQSWTIGSNGSTGELYLGRLEKQLLGMGNRIGSYSPIQELTEANHERNDSSTGS